MDNYDGLSEEAWLEIYAQEDADQAAILAEQGRGEAARSLIHRSRNRERRRQQLLARSQFLKEIKVGSCD